MKVSRTIEAPAEEVWRVLIDTRLWPEWGPSVREVDSPERYIAAGVKGRIKTLFGIWLPFEITLFEPPTCWHWNVAGLPATGHRVVSHGRTGCELIFEVPYGAVPYAAVCRRAASRIARLAGDISQDGQQGLR